MFVYDDGYDDGLWFFASGGMRAFTVSLSAVSAKSGDNYLWRNDFGETVTFNMSGDVLQSVTLTITKPEEMFNDMHGNILGTYVPAS